MREFWRPLLLVVLAMLVPVVPFLSFGPRLEERIAGWLDPPPPPHVVALATVGILASDVLLPVPSSLVSTIAGAQLGIAVATIASWVGMTIGALLGFGLAKACGRPLVTRFCSVDDVARVDRLAGRYGQWLVILTRALPVLAEATVLVLGATQLSWRRFLPPLALSNLGVAAVYAVLGNLAQSQDQMPLALGASIALPLLAATIARWLLPRSEE